MIDRDLYHKLIKSIASSAIDANSDSKYLWQATTPSSLIQYDVIKYGKKNNVDVVTIEPFATQVYACVCVCVFVMRNKSVVYSFRH